MCRSRAHRIERRSTTDSARHTSPIIRYRVSRARRVGAWPPAAARWPAQVSTHRLTCNSRQQFARVLRCLKIARRSTHQHGLHSECRPRSGHTPKESAAKRSLAADAMLEAGRYTPLVPRPPSRRRLARRLQRRRRYEEDVAASRLCSLAGAWQGHPIEKQPHVHPPVPPGCRRVLLRNGLCLSVAGTARVRRHARKAHTLLANGGRLAGATLQGGFSHWLVGPHLCQLTFRVQRRSNHPHHIV